MKKYLQSIVDKSPVPAFIFSKTGNDTYYNSLLTDLIFADGVVGYKKNKNVPNFISDVIASFKFETNSPIEEKYNATINKKITQQITLIDGNYAISIIIDDKYNKEVFVAFISGISLFNPTTDKLFKSKKIIGLSQEKINKSKPSDVFSIVESLSFYYRNILNSINYPLIAVNMNGITDGMNKAAEELLDIKDIQAIHEQFDTIFNRITIVDKDSLYSAVNDILNNRNSNHQQLFSIIKTENKLIDISIDITPNYDSNKKIIGALILFKDISEKRKQELVNIEQAKQLNLTLEFGKIGLWEIDIETQHLKYHKNYWTTIGIDDADLPPDYNTMDFFFNQSLHPDFLTDSSKIFMQLVSDEIQEFALDLPKSYLGNPYRWYDVRGFISQRFPDGKPKTISGVIIDINKQKEQALLIDELNDKFKLALNSGELVGWEWSLNKDQMEFFNKHSSIGDVDNISFVDFVSHVHLDDYDNVYNEFLNIKDKKTSNIRIEFRSRIRNGIDYTWFEIFAFLKTNPHNNNQILIGFIRNIDERKTKELEIYENREQLRMSMILGKIGVWTKEVENNEINYDNDFWIMLGSSPNQIESFANSYEYFINNIHIKDRKEVKKSFENMVDGFVFDIHLEFRSKAYSKDYIWYQLRSRIILNQHNNTKTINTFMHIIQEQKDIEQALIDAQFKLEEAQSIAKLGHWSYSTKKSVFQFSTITEELLELKEGYRPLSMLRYIQTIVYSEDRRKVYSILLGLGKKDSEDEFKSDYRIFINGKIKYVTTNIRVYYDSKSNLINTFGTIQDVTKEKELQLELIQAKEKAEESEQLKSNFLANISHEIRTPLNGIVGYAQLFQYDLDEDSKKKYYQSMLNSSNMLLKLLEDIMDLSKLESNTSAPNNHVFMLLESIDSIMMNFEHQAKEKNIILKKQYGSSCEKIILLSDSIKISQILHNLVSNALKFSAKGTVEIGINRDDDFILISVKDEGIGIKKDKLNIVFERFRQADEKYSRKFGGVGLGLYICSAIAKILGGKVIVESEFGKGSTFTLYLPVSLIYSGKISEAIQ